MSDAQAYAKANDSSNPYEGDDDGVRFCPECQKTLFFLPGKAELRTCLDHCDTEEELRNYILELQEERENLKRAMGKMINPESVKRPLPVDWVVLRERLMSLELANDNLIKLNEELKSQVRYRDGLIEEFREGLTKLSEMARNI